MSYNPKKQEAALAMLDAYGRTYHAYQCDPTSANMDAMHACLKALTVMLKFYFMEEQTRAKE